MAYTPVRRAQPLDDEPIGALPARRGIAAWFMHAYNRVIRGRGRIANDAVTGYTVYVGYGQMPDFTAAPAGFGATLPVPLTITPPVSGTVVLWVVTRARDAYGLESQNTQPQFIQIDTAGNEVLGVVSLPLIPAVILIEDDAFLVQLSYPGFATDPDPADYFILYVGVGVPPVPGVDTPVTMESIGDVLAVASVGPYPTGGITYYFAVTVYRSADGFESAAGLYEVTLPADPALPLAVPGGFIADNEVE